MKDLHEDSKSRKWLPQQNNCCKVCQKSHEADEFFNSILDIATAEFMISKGYLDFLKETGFMENEEDMKSESHVL
jgi:hypothetical protein